MRYNVALLSNKEKQVRYKIPNTVTCGVLIEWQNKYSVKVDLSFNGCYVTTDNHLLKKEIIDIGGTFA